MLLGGMPNFFGLAPKSHDGFVCPTVGMGVGCGFYPVKTRPAGVRVLACFFTKVLTAERDLIEIR